MYRFRLRTLILFVAMLGIVMGLALPYRWVADIDQLDYHRRFETAEGVTYRIVGMTAKDVFGGQRLISAIVLPSGVQCPVMSSSTAPVPSDAEGLNRLPSGVYWAVVALAEIPTLRS